MRVWGWVCHQSMSERVLHSHSPPPPPPPKKGEEDGVGVGILVGEEEPVELPKAGEEVREGASEGDTGD